MLLCEFVCLFVYLFPRRRLGFAQEISYAAASKAQAFADLVGAGGRVFCCLHTQQCKSMQNNMIKQVAASKPKLTCTPEVEPGSQAWAACMMPLHYARSWRQAVAQQVKNCSNMTFMKEGQISADRQLLNNSQIGINNQPSALSSK